MYNKEFKDFFKSYSKNVDNANSLAFWKLSDALILEIIKKYIPINLPIKSIILDAGGGTGRWISNLSKIYKSHFILYDLSEDMLAIAHKNIKKTSIKDRVKIMCGDLINMKQIDNSSVNYVTSIYSPISFIYQKEKAIEELYRVLKKGGRLLIMGHSYYNAIASKINNYTTSAEELETISKNSMIKWAKYVPDLNIFSKKSMENMLRKVGFKIISTYGVPIFVQPGLEDFDPLNSKKSRISNALSDKDFYNKVFKLEMKHNTKSETVDRGMNIFTIAEK